MMLFFFLFIFGLAVGSFLNVCIYRLPLEKSIVFPPSKCPKCEHRLGVLDLFPVFSFLFLRGKCRYCKTKIYWRYPVVELLTGCGFLMAGLYAYDLISLLTAIYFISAMIVIFFTDLEHFMIPDVISIPGIFIGLGLAFINGSIISALWGVLIGGGLIWGVLLLGQLFYKKEVMGFGDVKLVAMLGAFLGRDNLIVMLYLGFLIGGVLGVLLILTKIRKREDMIPFGPALILGALPLFYYGDSVRLWWWGLMGLS